MRVIWVSKRTGTSSLGLGYSWLLKRDCHDKTFQLKLLFELLEGFLTKWTQWCALREDMASGRALFILHWPAKTRSVRVGCLPTSAVPGFWWDLSEQKWFEATVKSQRFRSKLQPSLTCSSWKNLWWMNWWHSSLLSSVVIVVKRTALAWNRLA